MTKPETHTLVDNGIFPGNVLPVLHYKNAFKLPLIFPARIIRQAFQQNNWTNNWRDGIYTFDHYHSLTHEVIGVYKGKTTLQLGGDDGLQLEIKKGDVIVIPAGVAHRNLGRETDVLCIGGYPEGKDFDMNFGKPGERPQTDQNIASLKLPDTDPVTGKSGSLVSLWKRYSEE